MMPVLRNVACMGIGPVTAFRFCVAFLAAAGVAAAVGAGAAGFAPPTSGLRICGRRMTGLSLIVEAAAAGASAAGVGAAVMNRLMKAAGYRIVQV